MVRQLMNDLKAYFNHKTDLTTEERGLKERLNEGYFPITSVHRDDLIYFGVRCYQCPGPRYGIHRRTHGKKIFRYVFWGKPASSRRRYD